MKKRFEIINISEPNGDALRSLKIEDYLLSIAENRDRIRFSASQLTSISGMLLSVSFIMVLFLVKENYSGTLINFVYMSMF
jgi:hypothetical protein